MEFLDIYLPKVPPPRLDETEELIVVDEWPEKTPAAMPTATKDMFLPVFFFLSCFFFDFIQNFVFLENI